MNHPVVSAEMLLKVRRDRAAIEAELPELHMRDARLTAAAAEETLTGHLRRAIHSSRRPLAEIAADARIGIADLCGFLEGEQILGSDVLDRLTAAAGVVVSVSLAEK